MYSIQSVWLESSDNCYNFSGWTDGLLLEGDQSLNIWIFSGEEYANPITSEFDSLIMHRDYGGVSMQIIDWTRGSEEFQHR